MAKRMELLSNLEAGEFFRFEGETELMVVRVASKGTDDQGEYTLKSTQVSDWESRDEFRFWAIMTVPSDERVVVVDDPQANRQLKK